MQDLLGTCTAPGTDVVTFACIPIVIENVIFWLFVFAGVVALYFIIFSGIKLLTSQGDPDKVTSAKKTLTWAIIGLCVVLLSVGIVRIFGQVVGIDCTHLGIAACTPGPHRGP